jgi:hypothetical protein
MALVVHGRARTGPVELVLARCHPHPDRLHEDRAAEAALSDWLRRGGG